MGGAEAPTVLAADNQRVKRARRLARSRRARADEHCFVIESPGLITDAVDAGIGVEFVLVPEGTGFHPSVIDTFAVAPRVFDGLSTTSAPQPALAVAQCPERTVPAGSGVVLALAGVADPGNAGTLIRAAEAAGAVGVWMIEPAVDPFGPKTVRASAGSVFRLAVAPLAPDAFMATTARLEVWGAAAHGGVAPDQADLAGSPVLVLGSEAHGVDRALGVRQWLTIPMDGGAESLNVAMAGTVIMFEARRQRRESR